MHPTRPLIRPAPAPYKPLWRVFAPDRGCVLRSVNQEPVRAVVERRREQPACGLNNHEDMKTTDELLDETRAKLAGMRVAVDGEDYEITGAVNPERLLLRTELEYQPRYGYYAETPSRDAITSLTLRMQDGGGNPHTLRVVFCVEDKVQHAYRDQENLDDGTDGAVIALGVPSTTDFCVFSLVRVDYSGAVEEAMRLFPAGRGYSDGVEITTEERGITKSEELHGDRLRDAIYSSLLTRCCWLTIDKPLTVGNLEHRGEGGLGPGHVRWVAPDWFDSHRHK